MPDTIEFVYFEGCPNADAARNNLRAALSAADRDSDWAEWDLMSDDAPDRIRSFASPTILINGSDITGVVPGSVAPSCRSDPIPTVALIRSALSD